MNYPKISLAVDNCFASKRWTTPQEWADVIQEAGLTYIEASADNESDPLYADPEYLEDWIAEVENAEATTGVKVVNLYSGHGTYSTLGLAHTDKRVRTWMLEKWLKPRLRQAVRLKAGVGFFCHAFSESVLQHPDLYAEFKRDLFHLLADVSVMAAEYEVGPVGVEQMYSPHQIPWTIEGARELLQTVFAISRHPLYLTIDTGHQSGQRQYVRPGETRINDLLRQGRSGKTTETFWFGSNSAYTLFRQALAASSEHEEAAAIRRLSREMDRFPYCFACEEDGDPYRWLERLACYSPIIHLQQTNGLVSAHQPFTQECNAQGIIWGDAVLRAIASAYEAEPEEGMPPRCDAIYLTLEPFSKTADYPHDIRRRLRESVAYWRQYVPEDGLSLDQLLTNGGSGHA